MNHTLLLIFFLSASLAGTLAAEDRALYLDPAQPREARVEDLLRRMTLEEKVTLLHGDSKFTTAAIPRLRIPRRWMSDGPHGVREDIGPDTWQPAGHTDDFSTCMPAQIALASTWDPALAQKEGEVIGQEALARGKQIMLGPGVNILRTPLGGRTFEYLGEDPWLTGRMAVGYIRGVQSQGVASCVKHFAANNQEWDRMSINVEMDERALREIYLPAFKAAVQEAGVLAVMGAYNEFRGQHCCENAYLLKDILKGEWGFENMVISDWGGTHDTREAALNGLDLEMGTEKPYAEYYLAGAYLAGLRSGQYPMAGLDDKVRRNLRVMIATHMFDQYPKGSLNTAAHQAVARRVAERGMVLLKNEKAALPLNLSQIHSLAIIGENAVIKQAHGGESSGIKAFYEVTPLEGIIHRAGKHATVTYARGYGADAGPEVTEQAVRAAQQADVAIVFAGLGHDEFRDTEGSDRKDLKLPNGQGELISKVRQANPRTIVVLVTGSPVQMDPWLAAVPAVLEAWYSGMEGGSAVARVLFGDVNPSGKLPCTFPKRLEDSPAHALGAYPGTNGTERYAEGLLVGYRYFDTKEIEPLFAFGHGLSYTQFEYSNLKLAKGQGKALETVTFDLANTGKRTGAEVAQVYIHQSNPRLPRPFKELKGFKKVTLEAGEHQTISIPLETGAFAFYDPAQKGWVTENGGFEILVGSSSRDIRLQGKLTLDQSVPAAH
ncbi:MAG TPA: glycoside hydrolase family 3 C-terminal domain-containing protein [Candidatus Saccharimonadales bacterium]|nr:glycoside hydrolase family 3 C-terminal domain-containing protein [Candidatus Saccharimonadales bacterium]